MLFIGATDIRNRNQQTTGSKDFESIPFIVIVGVRKLRMLRNVNGRSVNERVTGRNKEILTGIRTGSRVVWQWITLPPETSDG
jgi:hypothetical protein